MNTNQKNIGVAFWLTWVLSSTIGFGLGAILDIAALLGMRTPDSVGFPILFGAIFGAIGAFAQWTVIRRQIQNVDLWIPFSALAFMLAVATAASMDSRLSSYLNPFFVIAAIYGLLGGFLQGLILEKQGVFIGWWIIASLVGGLIAGAMNGSALAAVQGNAAWQPGTIEFLLIWFRIGAPIGLGLGITTGAALVWFSRNPKSGKIADTASQSAQ